MASLGPSAQPSLPASPYIDKIPGAAARGARGRGAGLRGRARPAGARGSRRPRARGTEVPALRVLHRAVSAQSLGAASRPACARALLSSIPPRAPSTRGWPRCRRRWGRGWVVTVCVGSVFSFSRWSGRGKAGRRGRNTSEVVFLPFRSPGSLAGTQADGKMCAGTAWARA